MQFSHTIQLFETNEELVEDFIDAVLSLNDHFIITFWNQGAERMFGYTKQQAIGMSLDNVLSSERGGLEIRTVIANLVNDREWRGDLICKKKNNDFIYCMSSIVMINQNNHLNETLFVIKDITNRKALKKVMNIVTTDSSAQESIKEIEMTNSIERSNDGFVSFNRNWCYLHINKKAADILNREPQELIGKNVWIEFPELVNSVFYRIYHEVMETKQYRNVKSYSPALSKWFEVDIYPSKEILSIFFKDMSEKMTSESSIRAKEERYHAIFENAQDGIWMIDEYNKITFVNLFLSNIMGYGCEDMVGKDLFFFIHPEFIHLLLESIERKRNATEQYDIKLQTKNNETLWVTLHVMPIINNNLYAGSLILVMNIETRLESERALKSSNIQLRQLASKLQTIREEERSAIAREIHDDLAQQLTALKMDVYWLSKNLNVNDKRIKQKTDNMLSIVSETLDRLRKKAIELHPSLLNDLGLIAAMEWQNNEFKSRHCIQITFTVSGNDDEIPPDIAIAFYRIYQESLSNISKHAHATSITCSFISNEKGYYLAISDNGKGFDTHKTNQRKSLGLVSIKERSIGIGATCLIDSEINKGTLVSVFVEL